MNNKNGIAPMGFDSSPSGPCIEVSNRNYTTDVNTDALQSKSECPLGSMSSETLKSDTSAETKALWLLRESGFNTIQQLDWIGKKDDEWFIFEIKEKELFEPGSNFPYWGAGLNKSQLFLRTQLLETIGWRTYLLVFATGIDKVYGGYLDELDKGIFYDTQKGIRIYPIDSFEELRIEGKL